MARKLTRQTQRSVSHLTRHEALEQVAPSRLVTVAALTILALLAGAIFWSSYVTITTVAHTSGEIVPSGDERVVQHLEGGIVRQINVRDGDLVRAGDVLLRFDPTVRRAELDQIRAREAALTIRERWLRALINDQDNLEFGHLETEYPDLVEEAKISLIAARARTQGQVAVLRAQMDQRRRAVGIFDEQVTSLSEQIALVREVTGMREELFEKGVGTRLSMISARLEESRIQGALAEAKVSREQAVLAVAELDSQISEISLNERSASMETLGKILAELAEVRQNLQRLNDRVDRLTVSAPIDGIVHRLRINTPGAVVEPAQVLMTLVPTDEDILAEVRIRPSDIGYVEVGQTARVMINGFDLRTQGAVDGTLQQISATTYETPDQETYFRGRIVLTQDTLGGSDTPLPAMVPGMTLQADIATGRQTLLEYLAGPVYEALTGAFSER